jgi:tetratricopeptide (TPR) repeat protein
LPGLPPDLRARLLAQLFYNLVVAVRPDQAEQHLKEAIPAVEATRDSAARFTIELAEAMLHYTRGRFEIALALIDAALHNSSADLGEDPRWWLARYLRSTVLIAMDRLDEALAGATEGIRAAQHGRQAWALQLYETSRARQLLQRGQLTDAVAALEGRFRPDNAHLVVGVPDSAASPCTPRTSVRPSSPQPSRS